MSSFQKGDTYWGPLKRSTSIPHLWIILTDPSRADGKSVAANVTDFQNNQGDTTCVLDVGDHPRITKRSVINYNDAQMVDESKLQEAERSKYIVKCEPATERLLAKVQEGALTSDDMNPRLAERVRIGR